MSSGAPIQFIELAAWMRKNRKKLRSFAREADLDKMTLHRLLNGNFKRFDPDIIRRIHNATEGEIQERHFTAYFQRLRREAA